jgi:probable phosphoglycerate mutase
LKAILYADGACRGNPGPAGAGAVLLDGTGRVIAELTKFLGVATNNVAEYEGLIIGLERAQRLGVDELEVRMDSKLVVEQMSGRWKIKHPNMKPLALKAGALLATFPKRTITHVPRDQNEIADALSNRAIDEAS